jgi:hypothetical protein
MPSPTPSVEYPRVVTTIEDLDAAPNGYIAIDQNLLVFTKPFHASNQWLLGGFTEKFPASAISLPARLYRITPDGQIIAAVAEGA